MSKRPLWNILTDWFTRLVEAFFISAPGRISRWLNPFWAAALYLGGLLHWCFFLNWGKVPFDLHDWTETGAYFSFLRRAFLTNQLPLHIGSTLVPTERYLAQPETLISPQAYLLRFLEPGLFTLVNLLILYSVATIGLLLLRKRYALAPAAFSVMFMLFNFNGHITAHYAVGHREWTAYFFLPFFVFLLLKVLEGGKPDWKWVLLSSLTMLGMTLQGGFHFILWCMIFLVAWGLFSPKYLVPAIKVCIFGGLFSLFHLLPAAVEYIGGGKAFISGFPTVADLFAGMVVLKYPQEALSSPFSSLGWWELDTYIGLVGLAFLVLFGVYQTWRKGSAAKTLLAPIAVVTFLSIGQVYSVVNHLPIPLTDSERISSRFFIVPLVALVILGSIHLQEWLVKLGRRGFVERLTGLSLLILMAHDLFQHSRIWRVTNMYRLFKSTPVDIRSAVINRPDPPYLTALAVGSACTLLALVVLVVLAVKKPKPQT